MTALEGISPKTMKPNSCITFLSDMFLLISAENNGLYYTVIYLSGNLMNIIFKFMISDINID